jgi:hypothetical protein
MQGKKNNVEKNEIYPDIYESTFDIVISPPLDPIIVLRYPAIKNSK